ncbi:MAG: hypothetical protein FWC11_04540 [Firmicutes bacterium]|nr:hypothetical protein [Bacillota bacterium]MCL2256110.1 hypothetical protein [Bacillota bacterium]
MKNLNIKKRLVLIIDGVLTFFVASFFSIAFIGYFSRDLSTMLIAGITCALSITALIMVFQKKRRDKTLKDNDEIKEILTQFIYNDEEFSKKFFHDAFLKRYASAEFDEEYDFLKVQGTAVFFHFSPGEMNAITLGNFYKNARKKAKKILILSVDGLSDDAEALKKLLPDPELEILDGEKVFSLLNWLGAMPEKEIVLKKPKLTGLKYFFSQALKPKNARRYFFVAFVLMFSSFFMPHSVYYIIFASLCIVLGIASKIDVVDKIKSRN